MTGQEQGENCQNVGSGAGGPNFGLCGPIWAVLGPVDGLRCLGKRPPARSAGGPRAELPWSHALRIATHDRTIPRRHELRDGRIPGRPAAGLKQRNARKPLRESPKGKPTEEDLGWYSLARSADRTSSRPSSEAESEGRRRRERPGANGDGRTVQMSRVAQDDRDGGRPGRRG
jgi:hypothetical protein